MPDPTAPEVARDVVVVTGTGGMGAAIAHRLAPGRTLVLTDVDEPRLDALAGALAESGHEVVARRVDVSDGAAVAALADAAAALGPVRAVAHTAGVSPVQAPADAVVAVDLVGTAHVLEEFGRVIAPGGAGVVIASMSGHLTGPIAPEDEAALAGTPAAGLAALDCVVTATGWDSGLAYGFAKRANQLRVRSASVDWGRRGARLNSVSPGIIATPMGRAELDGPFGATMRTMLDGSPAGRAGTADDIAAVVAFLVGPGAAYVTGTDVLVDGGVVGALTTGRIAF
jgi:NAD(P)-dependent dehydrogenase (short-subunit alcohol dehydrogenase family)